MNPQMYALLERNQFVSPPDPGDIPNYGNQFASAVAVKMADRVYNNKTNNLMSYCNISCALFRMLDENITISSRYPTIPTYKVGILP
jgi:hypothetical protein